MGPAAQFQRVVRVFALAHRQHTDFFAIFFAKQSERAGSNGIIGCHQPRRYCLIAADLGVYVRLDHRNLLRGHCLIVREVEPQAIRRHHAALLRHMLAQAIAQ